MGTCEGDSTAEPRTMLGRTVPLAAVRGELAVVEALERELTARGAELRALLSPEQARQVWALWDAEQRLALAEHDLLARRLVDALVRDLPEHAATIRARAARLLDED
jgi:hypothetical protein